ncbi:MAG TPA: hypothetical protein VNO30_20520 [Kofleriaceae bacterium]|nr:hypothetical protein [Kofleriaceae bacterium]
MRRPLLVTLLILGAAPAHADEPAPSGDDAGTGVGEEKGTLGVGLMIGEPLGVCGRLYLKDDQAIQAAIGASFFGGGVQLHADYAFHPYIVQSRESFVLATYVGPGVRIIQYGGDEATGGYFALGLRAVGGLLFDFKNPLDAFFEVAGVFEYGFADGQGVGFAFNAAAGVRYYF